MTTWDEFEPPITDFPPAFKWDRLGASIAGTITKIRTAIFDDRKIPELWIETDDGEMSVLCGQANLFTQLLELKPQVGDRIAIKYVSTAKAKLGTAKIFEVAVKYALPGETVSGAHVVPDGEPFPSKSAADLL